MKILLPFLELLRGDRRIDVQSNMAQLRGALFQILFARVL
jgi:hypothetical protein